MKKVLFICIHNSARSQMAEALLNNLFPEDYIAYSAGIEPAKRVNPYVVKALAEVGIDISKNRPKSLEVFNGWEFDYVVTVCEEGKENCPFFPGGKIYLHKSFPDPASLQGSEEEIMEKVREIREEIKRWLVETFSQEKGGRIELRL